MRMGLVRHFKVEHIPVRGWITGEQFNRWVAEYDAASIRLTPFTDHTEHWDYCISSDLPRAVHTARHIYSGDIALSEQLREIGVAAVKLSGLKLPAACWMVIGRLLWLAGHPSQPESRRETTQRIISVLDKLEAEPQGKNVLIITHGAFMKQLERELRRRSYSGQRMKHPRNGQLYVYEK
ncbi:hypothetical protein PAECIP111892_00212 [Paenibacillus auburnensis]|uniref:Phosphoglycerate mutase n=1 Tax=Paenibacillus auburnensis TaxID=2905649 RepID=A0ABN8FTM3_9BACL|nr:histidine phosphatase family protein [Paenibacillus auburnensis]CAH1190490.1 hypothetical protein PAECIP111892_00212 [Paenibacillus auburnensis]